MVVTVLKKTFYKAKPREVICKSYRDFNETEFKKELNMTLRYNELTKYDFFESFFLQDAKVKGATF